MKRQGRGFTLVELLVVIAVIGVLIAMLFPAISGSLGSMTEVRCQNNMGQLAKVTAAYCADYRGSFPLFAGRVSNQLVAGSASNWLYGLTAAGQPDFATGLFVRHKYIGDEEILYCPLDYDRGLPRPTGALKRGSGANAVAPTSYVINASITYGDYNQWPGDKTVSVRSRTFTDFEPTDFLFIEEACGVPPDPPEGQTSVFDKAHMTPDSGRYALTNRHRDGGFVACMDGHVEWFSTTQFKEGMDTVGGGAGWYRKVLVRPQGAPEGKVTPEETGARWNPG